MHPRKQALKALKESGFLLDRQGANHEIFRQAQTGKIIPLKRHDFNENDLRYILKEIRQYKEGNEQH